MKIEIKLEGSFWLAEHRGPGSEEIERLFGTNTLPTPYTCKTPATAVLATLRRLNPRDEVVLAA